MILKGRKKDEPFRRNTEPSITLVGKTNKDDGKINRMLPLLCLLNVYKTSTTVPAETKGSSAEEEEKQRSLQTETERTHPVSAVSPWRA